MIYYVVTRQHADTLGTYLDTWGRRFFKTIRPIHYEDLPFYRTLPRGTYIFTDLEMLSAKWLELATATWQSLSTATPAVRILNPPTAVLRRYELLNALHTASRNDFAVYRADQIDRPLKFPVFVRHVHMHNGSLTPLLEDQAALDRSLAELAGRSHRLSDLLVIEFCDTADSTGLYRKYSAMKIGDRVLPRHLLIGGKWVLKYPDRIDDAAVEEERQFLENPTHLADVAAVFELAKVDYGRIDYSLKDGRVQTWEINSNPTIAVSPDLMAPARLPGQARFIQALAEEFSRIDTPSSGEPAIALTIPPTLRRELGATYPAKARRKLSAALGRLREKLDPPRSVGLPT